MAITRNDTGRLYTRLSEIIAELDEVFRDGGRCHADPEATTGQALTLDRMAAYISMATRNLDQASIAIHKLHDRLGGDIKIESAGLIKDGEVVWEIHPLEEDT